MHQEVLQSLCFQHQLGTAIEGRHFNSKPTPEEKNYLNS